MTELPEILNSKSVNTGV